MKWLGDVPNHWDVRRLGYYFTERREKVSDKTFQPLSVTKAGIVPQLDSAAKTDDGENRKKVCAGDFVINSRSDRKGSSGVSVFDGSVSLINTVLIPDKEILGAFAHYLLRSVGFQEEYYRYGKGIVADLWSTNYSEMKNISLPNPPLSEQSAICAFLNSETAKFDELVTEQQRLIALLKEKRQAVICDAITKGIDFDVPMKPSGLAWPEQIPAHWQVLSLTRVVKTFVDYRGATPTKVADGVPLITAGQIKNGSINHALDPVFISEAEYTERMTRGFPEAGDVLLTTEAPLGEVAQVEAERVAPGQRIIMMKPDLQFVTKRFLFTHFRSLFGQNQLYMRASGSTALGIRADRLRGSPVLVPPLPEQQSITDHIERRIAGFDQIQTEAEFAIALLKERRSALVSAAVTGKIDVRAQRVVEAEAA